ncbi:MAG: T9SS type A sorting domain-containing protein [Flavobacteriales bacterium]
MKAQLIAGLMLMTLQPCAAQSWCPPGAEWTHAYADVSFGGGHGITRVVYEGDSLVGGFMAQELRETNVIAPWGSDDYTSTTNPRPMLTRFADGVVYLWNDWPGEYDTLMWFDAAPGQFWASPGLEDWPDHRITVLDTSTVTVDGVPLRELTVQWGSWDWMPPDTLRERIGFSMNYLNGFSWFLTDQPWVGLRCYRDGELAFNTSAGTDCGFSLSIDDAGKSPSTRVFPNPGTYRFTLSGITPGSRIELFDGLGRRVFTGQALGAPFHFDASGLAPGFYKVRIGNGEQVISWIKE